MEILSGREGLIPALNTRASLSSTIRWKPAMSMNLKREHPPGSDVLTREEELMRLLPLWPHEVADRSPAGRMRLLAVLRRALRAERNRGLAGHWTYDLSRHAQLLAIYRDMCKSQDEAARMRPEPPGT
jgi:hypothetical protein